MSSKEDYNRIVFPDLIIIRKVLKGIQNAFPRRITVKERLDIVWIGVQAYFDEKIHAFNVIYCTVQLVITVVLVNTD